MSVSKKYRDKVYIIKDIIFTLTEHGEINQTTLYSYCGLNLTKHKPIIDELEQKGLLEKFQKPQGKRTITYFKVTNKGLEFCRNILDPFEEIFPRVSNEENSEKKLHLLFFV